MFVLFHEVQTDTHYLINQTGFVVLIICLGHSSRKEERKCFILWLYGVGHMIERGNPLPPLYGLFFLIA